nr:MAG TPA: tail protein [Caudoviricetes sp.]
MTEQTKNDKSNVSLGKPCAIGGVYYAPLGTALPKDATTPLAEAYKCIGYISEDGLTNSTDTDTTEVKEWGGATVLKEISSYSETYQFAMLEIKADSMKLRYGADNVTNAGDKLHILHGMPKDEHYVVVFEIMLTGNRKQRLVLPDASVVEYDDITYSAGDPITYSVTLSANPSKLIGGKTVDDYVEPLPTPVAGTVNSASVESH